MMLPDRRRIYGGGLIMQLMTAYFSYVKLVKGAMCGYLYNCFDYVNIK